MLRFFAVFLMIQLGLFAAELTKPVQQAVVIPFTESIAAFSAWLVKMFDSGVIFQGDDLPAYRDSPSTQVFGIKPIKLHEPVS